MPHPYLVLLLLTQVEDYQGLQPNIVCWCWLARVDFPLWLLCCCCMQFSLPSFLKLAARSFGRCKMQWWYARVDEIPSFVCCWLVPFVGQLRDFLMIVGFSGCYGMCLAVAGCVWLLLYATLVGVVMSRQHKLITLASNTTHKIVQSKQGVNPTRKVQVRFLCQMICNLGGFGRYLG